MIRTRRRANYLASSIALITFIIYLASLQNEFVNWDDDVYILDNSHIRSLDMIFFRWAFLGFHAANWHPLTWVSHALDYALWGLNPLGHHLTNIILHAINTFVVVLLAMRLLTVLKERTMQNRHSPFLHERSILIAAATTGLLFGLHPLHVESVAWVSERKDLLCALFFLLSIMAYVRYAEDASDKSHRAERIGSTPRAMRFAFFTNKHYLSALGFFILALLSKPMAVTLPVVLLMLDWHPFGRIQSFKTFRTACVEKLPCIALSLISSILTILAQKAGDAIRTTEFAPLSIRIFVAAKTLIAYLGKMIWPLHLVPFYPYPKDASLLSVENILPLVLVAGITIACALSVKKQKLWLSVWGYYVVTLIPVLGIVQVGNQSMADRYTYLPSLGPFFLVGLSAAWIAKHEFSGSRTGAPVKGVIIVAAFAVCAAMSYVTYKQTGIWKNGIVLWTYVIDRDPTTASFVYSNRGVSYEKAGLIYKAVDDYQKAIALNPNYDPAYYNLGVIYQRSGAPDKGIEYYSDSLAINPQRAEAFHNRGVIYFQNGQPGRALDDFARAIELNPNMDIAYYNRATLYLSTNRRDLALSDFRKACDLGSEDACGALASGEFSIK